MNKPKLTPLRILVAAFFLYGFMNIQTSAAPGDLDMTFSNGGKVITTITSQQDYARRVRIQPDGKIVTLGHSWSLNNIFDLQGSFITRHNPNGTVDTVFGSNGIIKTPLVFNDFIILPDGKLMIVGYGNGFGSGFVLNRYNSDGTIDNSFGIGGTVTTQVGGNNSGARKIVLQPDGKIVVFGFTYQTIDPYRGSLAVARYNADGLLDGSFGASGILITSIEVFTFFELIHTETKVEFFGDALIQPDGKLLVGVSNYYVSIVRLNSNGTFDNTFGSNGVVSTGIAGYEDAPSGIALQTDGKIVINGLAAFLGDIYFTAVLRFNANGTPDNTFGTGGKITRQIVQINSKELGSALAVQRDDKILTAGTIDGKFALARYQTNGAIDNSFGTNGILTTAIGNNPEIDTIFSMVFQPDGKLVATGSVKNSSGSYDLGLVRYLINSAKPTPFDYDGDRRADLSVFRPSDRTWYLNRSQAGFSATQFGLSTDKLTPADFDGDGKTDLAVFRDGFWYWLNNSNNQFNAAQFGQAGDVPVPADFTGDGRAEIAVFRAGVWYTLNLANSQFQATQFGIASDKPIPADFDGDGKADMAVVRQVGGASTWYVLGSTQGFYGFQFGTDTDKPVLADYDGDGKTDVAVFRPSDGNWYIRQTSSGINYINFGLGSDKPTNQVQ